MIATYGLVERSEKSVREMRKASFHQQGGARYGVPWGAAT
jgi:hypothetical protein